MQKKFAPVLGVVFAVAVAVACSSAPASSPAPSPSPSPSPDSVSEEAIPEGSKVVCHLDCSGNEAKAYGATEEEARANVRKFVDDKCNPDDGQFFIFCDPVE